MTDAQAKLAEALVFLMRYEGNFEFLVDMKQKASDPTTQFTEKQIDAVLKCKARAEQRKQGGFSTDDIEPGVYKIPRGTDFDIYKVQFNKQKTRKYAKKLVPVNGWRRNEEGDKVKWDWEYAPGFIRMCKPEYRMTEEDAREFGIKYAICAACGRGLKDAKSVEQGIGPVCIKHFRF